MQVLPLLLTVHINSRFVSLLNCHKLLKKCHNLSLQAYFMEDIMEALTAVLPKYR